eukprot:TRINITY_DN5636_c0_g4_i2.p2 TRINITY_DN5636_c0_g4~~TRINITY_DN5636_c0_g4_i2.p2  ORF type:complete len:150 (-),score=25.55 TRINITY_DN5636_c0_g4_i2:1003-1452(-)
MLWFRKLCDLHKVKGEAKTYWRGSVTEAGSKTILENYMRDIKDPKKAFIYHCYKHYLTPVGYEVVPKNSSNAFTRATKVSFEENEYWVLIGESSKAYPGLHVVKWNDIEKDLTCDGKFVYNIRQQYKGMQKNKDKINYHRLILFERVDN